MSMVGNIRAVPDKDIAALLERPGRVLKLLYDDDSARAESSGLLSFFRRGAPAEPDTWEPSGEGDELYIDKTWHGIHYLLTGSDWGGDEPLNFLVAGGREIGNVDVGYGAARALTSSEAQTVSAALDGLTPQALAQRFDAEDMTRRKIYPDEIWARQDDPNDDDDPLGYLIEYYGDLREFVRRAAENGHGLVVYIN